MRIRHCVEGTNSQWELIKNIEISIVFLLHETTQLLLHRSTILTLYYQSYLISPMGSTSNPASINRCIASTKGRIKVFLGYTRGVKGCCTYISICVFMITFTASNSFWKRAFNPSKIYTNMSAIRSSAS